MSVASIGGGLGLSIGPALGLSVGSVGVLGAAAGASSSGPAPVLPGSSGAENALYLVGRLTQFSATSTLLLILMDEERRRHRPDSTAQTLFALTAYAAVQSCLQATVAPVRAVQSV
ncbi:MAG: hypothetical protein ACK5NY_08520 [Burkholderiaceae bacterium]